MENKLEEALKTALEMEKQSYSLYSISADRAHNVVVEAVLRSLAEDEKAHTHVIERFYAALEKTHDWPKIDFGKFDTSSASQRISAIASTGTARLEPDSTYDDVYEIARDKEINARDFYIQQKELNNEDGELFNFFSFLANMEGVHMKMLDLLVEGAKAVRESQQNKE